MSNDLVVTPGGLRRKSLVHTITSGQTLRPLPTLFRSLDALGNTVAEIPAQPPTPPVVPSPTEGWIAFCGWRNDTGTPISMFTTAWRVPPAPATRNSQIIYLFNGMQNSGNQPDILQPVLQWGTTTNGGGDFWSIASWYATQTGPAFSTRAVRVNPGDLLVGIITLRRTDMAAKCDYTCEFAGFPESVLVVQSIPELVTCYEVLEAYSIQRCSDYPASDKTTFNAITVQTGGGTPAVNWSVDKDITNCGQRCVIVKDSGLGGEVDIYYH